MAVPFFDLTRQYATIRSDVEAAMARVLESQHFIMGAEVEAFEREMEEALGVERAMGVASGTDALLLPLLALEPKPGDEVVVPAFTFFATAGAAWNAGFTPAFCDVDPDTFNVTVETLEAAVTERTRAIIPVHLFGQMAPMLEIAAWAEERGLVVIEDVAQAIASSIEIDGRLHRSGSIGTFGTYSFFPTKNLGAYGDGGGVSCRDPELAERVAQRRTHGGRRMYHHEFVGTNSRLDALQAAVLRAKLAHLPGWIAARRGNAARYDEMLAGVDGVVTPTTAPGHVHTYNQYTLRVDRRDDFREAMKDRGIGTGLYYPVPMHMQLCFQEIGYREGQLPVSERLCTEVASLPVFPELEVAEVDEVGEAVRDFYGA